MATIKSFTDLSQSKVLAEILPLESADMFLAMDGIVPVMSKYIDDGLVTADETAIPCWSLAALLGILKERDDCNTLEMFTNKAQLYTITTSYYKDASWKNISTISDNPIDACVAMIEKLNKLKML